MHGTGVEVFALIVEFRDGGCGGFDIGNDVIVGDHYLGETRKPEP